MFLRIGMVLVGAGLLTSLMVTPGSAGPPDAKVEDAGQAGKRLLQIPGGEFRPRKVITVRLLNTQAAETQGWGLGDKGIKVAEAWTNGNNTKGEGIKVAILDTGVDGDHPELKGRVVKHKDFTGSPNGTKDIQGHGTHCAGIVAMGENGEGFVGVAPKALIYSGKVLGDDGSGDFEWLAKGINWAVDEKVDVISMSLGTGPSNESPESFSPNTRAAIIRAVNAGVIVLAAASNSGQQGENTVGFPGKYSEVITVAATDINQNVPIFSSKGPEVDVAAPGDDIWSTLPNGQYAQWDGTSMATPCAAGVAALYIASCRVNNKTPSQEDFRSIIKTKSLTKNPNPPSTQSGWGLIQAPAFVTKTGTTPDPELRTVTFAKSDFSATGWERFKALFPNLDFKEFKYEVAPNPSSAVKKK